MLCNLVFSLSSAEPVRIVPSIPMPTICDNDDLIVPVIVDHAPFVVRASFFHSSAELLVKEFLSPACVSASEDVASLFSFAKSANA